MTRVRCALCLTCASKAGAVMVSASQSSTPLDPAGPALPRERPRSPARARAAEYRPSFRGRSTRDRKKSEESRRAARRSRGISRAATSAHADVFIDKDVSGTRTVAWRAGCDEKGSSMGQCKNCCLGAGAHAPRHAGSSRRNLGSRCYLARNVPVCGGKQICHWIRDCPNRASQNVRKRRKNRAKNYIYLA